MGGLGHGFLRHSFDILARQTFKDFDVVVSDHSKNNDIQNLCGEFSSVLAISYLRNTEGIGSSSANTNNAIRHAKGKLIKILFLDDFLYHDNALQDIVAAFDIDKDHWMTTACEHSTDGKTFYRPYYPRYTDKVYLGFTSMSSPSLLTIKNDSPLLFDEKLVWLMDVEYYKRCYDAFGLPKILNTINVVNTTGAHQGVGGYKNKKRLDTAILKWKEYLYVLSKYEHGISYCYYYTLGFMKFFIKYLINRP